MFLISCTSLKLVPIYRVVSAHSLKPIPTLQHFNSNNREMFISKKNIFFLVMSSFVSFSTTAAQNQRTSEYQLHFILTAIVQLVVNSMETKLFVVILLWASIAVFATSDPKSHRQRRQTADTLRKCREIEDKARCSQPYLQIYFTRIRKCGPIANDIITSTESSCRRNENGDLCRIVLNSEFLSGNCSSNCTSECRSVLLQAGCCLNHTTGINQDFLANCDMPIPSECSSMGVEISDIPSIGSCNSGEVLLEMLCDLAVMDPLLIRPWKENEECFDLVEDYFDYCSSRTEQYCLVEFNGTTTRGQLLQEAESECSTVVSSNCSSSQCRSSLKELSTTFGCCIHAINTTRSGHESSSAFRYDLWKRCGVTMPTRCGVTMPMRGVTPTNSAVLKRFDLIISLAATLVVGFTF